MTSDTIINGKTQTSLRFFSGEVAVTQATNDLTGVLIRFREEEVAFSTDIGACSTRPI